MRRALAWPDAHAWEWDVPTQDGLTEQTAEVQSALREVLQESGTAGTGPLTLPPPANITSTQQRSEVRDDDPNSYSNTLNIDLYRDADGKVWTQPGPGHTKADIHMRVRRWQGRWHVVTEHQHVTRRRRIRGHIITDSETDAMATSGAPVTELGSVERFEQFSPQNAKEAIRQTIAKLQAKGAIYVYDPNAPVPQHTAGLLPNGLLALAAVAAAGAIAAFAGIGPFASTPASAAQTGAVQPGGTQISAAPAAAAAAASACGPNGSQNGAEDLNLTGAVTAHVTQDCGPGPTGGAPRCNPVQVLPYGKTDQSYTYDWYGGFYAGGVEYELHFPGSGIGSSFTVQYPRDPTAPNRGHVTMTSYESFAPASVWQSPDGAPTGAITWTPTTVTMSNVTLTSVASAPKPAAPVTMNGTWAVHCGAGAAGAAATGVAPTAVGSVAPSVAVAAPVATTMSASSGSSAPWGPELAVLALAFGALGVGLKTRQTASAPATTKKSPPDCSTLERELTFLTAKLADDTSWLDHDASGQGLAKDGTADPHWDAVLSTRRRMVADDRINIARVEEALARCRAGVSPDVVPVLLDRDAVTGADESALERLGREIERVTTNEGEPRGFDPVPLPAPGDDDDPKSKRQEIG